MQSDTTSVRCSCHWMCSALKYFRSEVAVWHENADVDRPCLFHDSSVRIFGRRVLFAGVCRLSAIRYLRIKDEYHANSLADLSSLSLFHVPCVRLCKCRVPRLRDGS